MNSTFSDSLKSQFLEPLHSALSRSRETRSCPALPDKDWLLGGVTRCIHSVDSGRDYLQMVGKLTLGITTYFESLKSNRRLKLVTEVANDIEMQMRGSSNDIISEHIPQLEDYDVWAGDGHWHEHATHDKRDGGKYYAVGHLYGWDLRHNTLHHLVTADQVTRKKEHDIRGLKRLSHDELRVGAPKGRKVIWIWDKAGIDFRQWHTWKSQSGIYFISLEKENMKLDDIAIPQSFDKEDPINVKFPQNDGQTLINDS